MASTQARHVESARQTSPLNRWQPLNYSTHSQFSQGSKGSKRCLKLPTTGTPPKPHETHTPTITFYDNTFNINGTSTSISFSKSLYAIILLLGPAKVWRACRKWQGERFPWHTAFTAAPIIYIYIYISYHLQSVNAFPLLSNNNEMETFFYKLGAVRSVDWIFII